MFNKVFLVGRLGQDPEVKEIKDGSKMATLNIATSEYYKDGDERKEVTDWHRVVCFRQIAEFAEKYLKKGRLVLVEGKNKTRQYEEDGQTKYITEIRAINIQPLDSKGKKEEK